MYIVIIFLSVEVHTFYTYYYLTERSVYGFGPVLISLSVVTCYTMLIIAFAGSIWGNCGWFLNDTNNGYELKKCYDYVRARSNVDNWRCGLLQCDVPVEEIDNIQLEGFHFLKPNIIDLGGKGRVCVNVMQDPAYSKHY